ncbi:hypothetical protein GP486_000281 [Trichoglossum hirsutum]|uniref:25S rRNA (uridine-N(3))-methyltransferase BMT5-like domain-containing protein n=1 Tax=Trichoglossum hirsutum TaxID=265104 RepID=A0A9P8RTP7_9PEZI|nr:hypothetical protein GP486_000281 [Trichoglossum hirsutum]
MGRNRRQKLLKIQSSKTGSGIRAAAQPVPQQKTARKPNPDVKSPLPFEPEDKILLVGEGDFSFARSLAEHHGFCALTATGFDTKDSLLSKYPQARQNIEYLVEEAQQTVLHGVDATKLVACSALRKTIELDRVVFNFPHVGGKSKDVNRQVRYNQGAIELLVGFFKAAVPMLRKPEGTIIVTVFEGEPYTLWNIKDLARHVGLRVGCSFKFQSEMYPGYKHARTLGNIEGGGGWRGETRNARTKRKGGESDSENEE